MAELAFFSEAILQTLGAEPQQQTPTVYVDRSTTEAGHYWELLGTGVAVVGGFSSKGEFQVDSVLGDELVDASRERVTFLIASRAAVQAWWETGKPALVVTELRGFPERDSLFLVEQSSDRREPGLTLKRLPPVTPSNPDFRQVFSGAR